jgi:hypothetical protein
LDSDRNSRLGPVFESVCGDHRGRRFALYLCPHIACNSRFESNNYTARGAQRNNNNVA